MQMQEKAASGAGVGMMMKKKKSRRGALRGWWWACRWTGMVVAVLGSAVLLVVAGLMTLQSLAPEVSSEVSSEPPRNGDGVGNVKKSSGGGGSLKKKPEEVGNKVAFLFLVRHQMPLDFVWEHFFQGAREEEYTVYIHARPRFVYTINNTKCSAFIDRQLKNPVVVEWGEASMLQAERRLLKEALQDPLNQRFILLSDSCVPVFNFRYIYDYAMLSEKSFVDSFTDPHDYQYDYKMAPAILKEKWRKGSQWFMLIRKHADAVVKDNTIFPVFQQYCKRMALPEFAEITKDNRNHNCIPDEHYLQTLLAVRDMETEIEHRGVTYSQWRSAHQHTMDPRGWHPLTFDAAKTTLQAIKNIQEIKEIHFVAASRREPCWVGSKALPCYLFARKFTRGAGVRLLDLAPEFEHHVSHV